MEIAGDHGRFESTFPELVFPDPKKLWGNEVYLLPKRATCWFRLSGRNQLFW